MTTLVYTLDVHYDTIHGIERKKMMFTSRDEAEKFRKRGGARGYYVTSLQAQVVFDADRAAKFIHDEKERINMIGQIPA